jgi:hypothetical protein
MKTVHKIVLKVLSVLMLVGGGSLLMMRINFTTYYDMVRLFKEYFWTPYGLVLGVVLIVLGFVGLLPVSAPKRIRNTISFSGTHGDVLIELDSVEANLGRVVSKMPEVKKSLQATESGSPARTRWLKAHVRLEAIAETLRFILGQAKELPL